MIVNVGDIIKIVFMTLFVIAILSYLLICLITSKHLLFFLYPPKSKSYREVVKLPWKIIKNIYAVNPKRLRYESVIEDGYTTIYTKRKALLLNYNSCPSWASSSYFNCYDGKVVAVRFSLIDNIRFFIARKANPNNTSTVADILNVVQMDIDKLRKQAEKEIDLARKITEEIGWRLK